MALQSLGHVHIYIVTVLIKSKVLASNIIYQVSVDFAFHRFFGFLVCVDHFVNFGDQLEDNSEQVGTENHVLLRFADVLGLSEIQKR